MWDESQGNLDEGDPIDFGDEDVPVIEGITGLQVHPPAKKERPEQAVVTTQPKEVTDDDTYFVITEEVITKLAGILWQRALAERADLQIDFRGIAEQFLENPAIEVVAMLSQGEYEVAADLLMEEHTFHNHNSDPHFEAVVLGTEEQNLNQEPEPQQRIGKVYQFPVGGKRK